MTRYLTPDRCAMIADALSALSPDTAEACEMRDQLERIMRDFASGDGAVLEDPDPFSYVCEIETDHGAIETSWRSTLAEVQVDYIEHRDISGLGASGFGDGKVHDNYERHVARISYNGRLWPPGEWTEGMKPLAEAPHGPKTRVPIGRPTTPAP